MTRTPLFIAALAVLAVQPAWSADPEPNPEPTRSERFIATFGEAYHLSSNEDGRILYQGEGMPEKAETAVLNIIENLPEGKEEAQLAEYLHVYLEPRQGEFDAAFTERLFLIKDDGVEVLTELGRTMLFDILTSEDGRLFGRPLAPLDEGQVKYCPPPILNAAGEPAQAEDCDEEQARAEAMRRRLERTLPGDASAVNFDGGAGNGGYDAGLVRLGGFDWDRESAPNGSLSAAGTDTVYAVDEERGTVRVMISAKRAVSEDRLGVGSGQAEEIFTESGLDAATFRASGAQIVMAVDNLIVAEVSRENAAAFGKALQAAGIENRPARVFHQAAASLPNPVVPSIAAPLSPLAQQVAQAIIGTDGRAELGTAALHDAGMKGKGAIVGIVDSGMDLTHPDLADAVVGMIDFTEEGEGLNDQGGHGTHVAGSVLGRGTASDGTYQGQAPEARALVAKVFNKSGRTSEDRIIAALASIRGLHESVRPQVVNLSLGGPGHPDFDPLSHYVNKMMIEDDILIVTAAGNSGPWPGSIGAPGNAQYGLTVTGVDHEGNLPFFPSRGPVRGVSGAYAKPDVAAVAGAVNIDLLLATRFSSLSDEEKEKIKKELEEKCVYAPGGVISTRSKDDPNTSCTLPGMPNYRYMSGTSMATPMVSGLAADVAGYMRGQGRDYSAVQLKALIMESAHAKANLAREEQGAGMISGQTLASAARARAERGLPIGNVAYMLAQRLTTEDRQRLERTERYEVTPLGILDRESGRLIRNDEELWRMIHSLPEAPAPAPMMLVEGSAREPLPLKA